MYIYIYIFHTYIHSIDESIGEERHQATKKTVAVLTLQVENKMVHTYHLHNIFSL